jgi:transposase
MAKEIEKREAAIHLLRAGHSVQEVAQELERHPNWVWKWYKRYRAGGWSGLKERSRAPKKHGRKIKDKVWRAICQARSELEAEAEREEGLKYIGPTAVRTKLKAKKTNPLPSTATIERVLRENKMTRPYQKQSRPKVAYPHLKPTTPLQLCQVDIVPHYLTGGERVACFNAIDVVSRYPTGQPFNRRRSQDAAEFLVHTWQQIGIPTYTQVDNEGCFSGGATHPYVLGKILRLALAVETELVFSPFYHPESNGYVERFHQDYNQHVWDATYLHNRSEVQSKGDAFFEAYRHSEHHSALHGLSPQTRHAQVEAKKLSPDFLLPSSKLPLYEGRVHFIRRVEADGTISVLNVRWAVPNAHSDQGVWATLEFQSSGATLKIYNAAPDVPVRHCLASYLFPLKEPVLARPTQIELELDASDQQQTQIALIALPEQDNPKSNGFLVVALITQTLRLASRFIHTMY